MPGFDAYHKWMGIPPEEQPADHYRLLGLVRFESDRDVIDASVNKQMSYLRICAKGEHADQAEEILNQVSQARLCLLDDRQKRVYDARLRGSASAAPQTLTTDWSIETETAPGADRPSRENAASASDSVPGRNRDTASFSRSGTPVRLPDRKSRPFRRDWSDRLQTHLRQPFVWIPAVCLLAAVVTVSLLSSPSDEDPSPRLADAGGTESSGGPPEPTVAPFDATQARHHQQEWADYLGTPVETTNSATCLRPRAASADDFRRRDKELDPRGINPDLSPGVVNAPSLLNPSLTNSPGQSDLENTLHAC
jgi:hypothetical protein